ncbi:ComEA family DNA-binding protein [Leucobacter chromiireducens]|uniref:Helix-hairpin-helix domain-containing protein n=1 Tax=Leucobacter chromiireducens subsp. chromiireducens TaxID=660067 RepID=A0ABS1SSG5_9MICO|nr:helix-hairpin-helix domain-containing protein [Leucobacter chromiireducens]MBL3690939.1 helix-hairpin-helix domain-containing protein [Leucobacter chromiireducens subsp. chromiireducens]
MTQHPAPLQATGPPRRDRVATRAWSAERVLAELSERAPEYAPEEAPVTERAPDPAGHRGAERAAPESLRVAASHEDARPALRRDPTLPWRERVLRALRAPVWAGVTVFVIVVLVAVGVAAVRSGGAASPVSRVSPGAPGKQVANASPGETSAEGAQPHALPAAGDSPPSDAAGSGATLWIHVVGEVRDPGLVELAAAARVADAIAAAGGATAAAELAGVNLARTLQDGEQLRVPNAQEAAAAGPPGAADGIAPGTDGTARGEPGGGAAQPTAQFVSLSRASAAELETLPRIGPALAARILEWRESNGGFASVEQLLEVPGIGDKTLDGLREYVVP